MADNKTVTNTKTAFDADTNPDYTVATDEIGSVDYQIVKLADGTLGSATGVATGTGAATNGLRIALADSSQITANAGTDLNTSALALESGGVLDVIAGDTTSLDGKVTTCDTDDVRQATHDNLNANANIQVGNADVANGNPVPVSDAGGSLTVDGTVAATQSGTWNITNVSGTVSLPTGAATSANQSTVISLLTLLNSIVLTSGGSVVVTPPSGIVAGAKVVTTAGTAEQLVGSSTPCKRITMTAEDDNTGKIYYGGSTVDSSLGDYLFPAQKIEIEIDNVQKIYIDADTNGDGVKFTYFT